MTDRRPSDHDDSPQREDFIRDPSKLAAMRAAMQAHSGKRPRVVPTPQDLASRRKILDTIKWVLPSLAALLLGSIAVWPEIARWMSANTEVIREMAQMRADTGRIEGATYRGLDSHDQPYTITSKSAHQVNADRVDLYNPIADTFTSGDGWAQVRADQGTYMQREHTLSLTGHVVVYRDDGTLINSPTMDLDLHRNVAASNDWVHAEGPFGILDAQGYFIDQQANLMQFTGPQRVVKFEDPQTTPSPTSSVEKRK